MSATVKSHSDQASLAATRGLIPGTPEPYSPLSPSSRRYSTGSPSPDGSRGKPPTCVRPRAHHDGSCSTAYLLAGPIPRSALHFLRSFHPEEIQAHPEHRLGRRAKSEPPRTQVLIIHEHAVHRVELVEAGREGLEVGRDGVHLAAGGGVPDHPRGNQK